jgi:hypothetical protein
MKYIPPSDIAGHLSKHGLDHEHEIDAQEHAKVVAQFSKSLSHANESPQELHDRAAYFMIWDKHCKGLTPVHTRVSRLEKITWGIVLVLFALVLLLLLPVKLHAQTSVVVRGPVPGTTTSATASVIANCVANTNCFVVSVPAGLTINNSTLAVTQSGSWTTGRTWTLNSGTDSVTALGSGNFTVVQATGTNLHIVCDSGCGSSSVNVTQFGGSNVVTGTGTSGAGIPRVTVSSDSSTIATQSSGANLHVNCDSGCGGAAADTTASGALGSLDATVNIPMAGTNSASVTLPAGNNLIGTLLPESSSDGGTTWQASVIRPATPSGIWAASVAVSSSNLAYNIQVPGGASHVRVRVNPYTSGTATAGMRAVTQQDALPDPLVQGTQAAASATQPNPVVGGGWDGAAVRSLKTDNTGILQIGIPGTVTVALPPQPFLNTTDFSDVVAQTPVLGDTIFANATPKWTKLSGSTSATDAILSQIGTGAVSAAPVWRTTTGSTGTPVVLQSNPVLKSGVQYATTGGTNLLNIDVSGSTTNQPYFTSQASPYGYIWYSAPSVGLSGIWRLRDNPTDLHEYIQFNSGTGAVVARVHGNTMIRDCSQATGANTGAQATQCATDGGVNSFGIIPFDNEPTTNPTTQSVGSLLLDLRAGVGVGQLKFGLLHGTSGGATERIFGFSTDSGGGSTYGRMYVYTEVRPMPASGSFIKGNDLNEKSIGAADQHVGTVAEVETSSTNIVANTITTITLSTVTDWCTTAFQGGCAVSITITDPAGGNTVEETLVGDGFACGGSPVLGHWCRLSDTTIAVRTVNAHTCNVTACQWRQRGQLFINADQIFCQPAWSVGSEGQTAQTDAAKRQCTFIDIAVNPTLGLPGDTTATFPLNALQAWQPITGGGGFAGVAARSAVIRNNTSATPTQLDDSVGNVMMSIADTGPNKTGQADIVASSGAINTTETVIVKTPSLAANRINAGTHIRIILDGTCTSTVANVSTFTLRWGTNGTTADGTVAAFASSVAAASGTNNGFRTEIDLTVRTAGAAATSQGMMQIVSDGNIGIVATPNVKSVAGTAFNTTTASGIFSLAYKSAATTTTSTFTNAIIEIVQN